MSAPQHTALIMEPNASPQGLPAKAAFAEFSHSSEVDVANK